MIELRESSEIKGLSIDQLKALAGEIREEIIGTVAETGGHLASNLGAVELTLALHYVFDLPDDKIVFDVGHQTYTHKLLTGRASGFSMLRKMGGLSGFPQLEESKYDSFTAGHASTAISAALGMAHARDIMHAHNDVIAVVGDGALTGGMCYEALNDAGHAETPLIVILNDNEMSISQNVGALSRYLTTLRQSSPYKAIKRGLRRGVSAIPGIGLPVFRFLERIRDSLKALLLDDKFFTALGFEYIGPINGHDIRHLIRVLKRVKHTNSPVLVHVVTQKGHGYQPAENRPIDFHGTPPFFVESGAARSSGDSDTASGVLACRSICEAARTDIRVCVITAAMTPGTGMRQFQERYPGRFYDVGIAEEHAAEMAGGLAASGMRPYVAIYSTFLARSYDQMLIDICRNSLPVVFLLDRAGFVGADGATHQGLFDYSYLRTMPNMIIAVPKDGRELKRMIELSLTVQQPMAIRYPKVLEDLGSAIEENGPILPGSWEQLSRGDDVLMLASGRMVQNALRAGIELLSHGIGAGTVNARFIQPMDEELLHRELDRVKLVVTIEENVQAGGFGEAVSGFMTKHGIHTELLMLSAKNGFTPHATIEEQLHIAGLDPEGIAASILACVKKD